MPNKNSQEAAPETTPDDPFDLGDTELHLNVEGDAKPKKAAPPAEGDSPVVVAPERPRNPDGTFSAFKEQVDAAKEASKPSPLSKHADYLVEAARDFGYDDAEIAEMSPSLLQKTMWQAKKRQEAARQEIDTFRLRDTQHVRTPEPTPEPEDEDYDLGLDPAHYDAGIVAAIKKVGKSSRDEVKSLKAQLAQRDARDSDRDVRRTAAMIDAAFAAMPEHEKIFGKGTGASLGDRPEMARRIAVLRQANIDMREIGGVGQLRAKLKAATDLIYAPVFTSDDNPYAAAAKPNGKPRITEEEWEAAALAKPTQRKGTEKIPKGDALAVAELTKKLKDSGGEVIPDSEELDGFFD